MKMKVLLALTLVLLCCAPASAVQRLPLIEDFTNDNCPPCDVIQDTMDVIFQGLVAEGKAAPYRPHVNWPSACDPMFLADQQDMQARIAYYQVNAVPTFHIDGTQRVVGYTNPVTTWYNTMRANFEARYNVPAAVSVTFQDVYRNANTAFVNFTVSYDEAVEDVGASQTVFLVCVESNHNYLTGKEWYPFRGFAEETGPAGQVINLANVGDSQSFSWTFRFDDPFVGSCPQSPGSQENRDKLILVAWVQKDGINWTQRPVLNSGWAPVTLVTTDVNPPVAGTRFELSQNVPNPFNPMTSIRYSLDKLGTVKLSVFDPSGRLVNELVNGSQPAGDHEAFWNGLDKNGKPAASGIYYYRLESPTKSQTRKMTLIK